MMKDTIGKPSKVDKLEAMNKAARLAPGSFRTWRRTPGFTLESAQSASGGHRTTDKQGISGWRLPSWDCPWAGTLTGKTGDYLRSKVHHHASDALRQDYQAEDGSQGFR